MSAAKRIVEEQACRLPRSRYECPACGELTDRPRALCEICAEQLDKEDARK